MDDSTNSIPPSTKAGDAGEKPTSSDKPADGASTASPQGQKRKWEPKNKRQQQGSKRHKGRDMGRQEYNRSALDKRQRNAAEHERRQQNRKDGVDDPKGNPFTQDEIEGDARQPKRKVAVMMGYAGSGYKGMQMMPDQKTIEGDLFEAFVKAGAISKANADDPKKSAFVRCARTDKGVHAAGNVISLKLIIEDEKIVQKINENLPAQIRVWGIERTIGSFSCYQACDSRWYEYLIPTHCFLPPHPKSYMGQKLPELAEESGDMEGYKKRQEEMEGFWEKIEEERIRPLLEGLDAETREKVEQALYHLSPEENELSDEEDEGKNSDDEEDAKTPLDEGKGGQMDVKAESETNEGDKSGGYQKVTAKDLENLDKPDAEEEITAAITPEQLALRAAIKSLKDAYLAAKREWRIPEARLERVRKVFALFKGTHNFHNYTVRKSFRDPSAKRHILSFNINPTPIIIGDTEWLSLKVHGQSFMMHQIRKMVGLAALVVRSGADVERVMVESFSEKLYSIPKAPALGLLLERPVFDNYNQKATEFEREAVSFTKYEKEMEEFKRKEIYERIFSEEERENVFHSFFTHVDNYRTPIFLYLSSKGLEACGDTRSEPNTKRDFSRKERGIHQNKKSRNKEAAWKTGHAKD